MKGYLITFEGVEGSGKSTQMARLADDLKKKGYPVITTREPGGTTLGTQLRSLVLDAGGPIAPKTELFLYLADRAQHLAEVIVPALARRQIVLCDRFTDSTWVYQGAARGLSFPAMKSLLAFAADAVVPDLTLILDMDVCKGLARLHARRAINRLDREAEPFHQKVREGYQQLARRNPKRIRLIDADQAKPAVFAAIQKEVDAFLS